VAVNDLAGIRVGSPVTIDAAGSGLPPFNAAVTSVFPSANDQTRTAVVEAIVSNPAQRLLPGEFVSVRITRSVASDKLLVPASAVISDGGATFVWVARGAQAAAHRVDVEIAARSGVLTEVDSNGLAAGDRVVTRGQAGLTEGAAVAETSWGPDGPRSLPTASQISRTSAIYRCEKCGMTYSASDAAKYHYVDPMDGGKLVEVKTAQGQGQ
jgi:RND family efflux transporter MFP subunit